MVSGVHMAVVSQCLHSITNWSCSWAMQFCISLISFTSATDAGWELLGVVNSGACHCCWGYKGKGDIMGGGEEYLGGENMGLGLGFIDLICWQGMGLWPGGWGQSHAGWPNCPQ